MFLCCFLIQLGRLIVSGVEEQGKVYEVRIRQLVQQVI